MVLVSVSIKPNLQLDAVIWGDLDCLLLLDGFIILLCAWRFHMMSACLVGKVVLSSMCVA